MELIPWGEGFVLVKGESLVRHRDRRPAAWPKGAENLGKGLDRVFQMFEYMTGGSTATTVAAGYSVQNGASATGILASQAYNAAFISTMQFLTSPVGQYLVLAGGQFADAAWGPLSLPEPTWPSMAGAVWGASDDINGAYQSTKHP